MNNHIKTFLDKNNFLKLNNNNYKIFNFLFYIDSNKITIEIDGCDNFIDIDCSYYSLLGFCVEYRLIPECYKTGIDYNDRNIKPSRYYE